MKIKTPSDLKYWLGEKHPDSHFFTRSTMKFFGDTMRNFRLNRTAIVCGGVSTPVLCLYRSRPVKNGLDSCYYFHAETLDAVRPD